MPKPLKPPRIPPDGRSLKKAESYIKNRPVEFLYVYEKNGKQTARYVGSEGELNFDDAGKSFEGKIITHNHPDKGTIIAPFFSDNDIYQAVRNNFGEMRVVYKNIGFSVKPKGAAWATEDEIIDMLDTYSMKEICEILFNLNEFKP
jgi:hypothetical protein